MAKGSQKINKNFKNFNVFNNSAFLYCCLNYKIVLVGRGHQMRLTNHPRCHR